MGLTRRVGSLVLALLVTSAMSVGVAPTASAGTYTSFPIAGVVKCKNGATVSGIWVDSSRGGSGFASFTRFPDASAAKYSMMLNLYSEEGKQSSNVTLKVGCGYKPNTADQWLTTSVTTRPVTVHPQGTSANPNPVWLNINCTPNNLQCAWPNVPTTPTRWDSKPGTQNNPFPDGWCTTGAAARWKDLTDVWPNWVGDGGSWGAAARNAGYTVESDVPRLGALVRIPHGSWPFSSAAEGHVAQVRDISISGSTVTMTLYQMNGSDGQGHSDGLWGEHYIWTRTWSSNGMLTIVPPYHPEGDANGDGQINLLDFSILSSTLNTGDWRADFNDDRVVNMQDFSLLSTWFTT